MGDRDRDVEGCVGCAVTFVFFLVIFPIAMLIAWVLGFDVTDDGYAIFQDYSYQDTFGFALIISLALSFFLAKVVLYKLRSPPSPNSRPRAIPLGRATVRNPTEAEFAEKQRLEESRRRLKEEEEKRREEERKRRESALRQKETALKHLRSLSGVEFEGFLAAFFRKQGYKVETTPGSGDQGADLLLYKGDDRIAVQAKQWRGSVGNKAVQEAHAGRAFYNTYSAWVVTTSFFTIQAVEAARYMGVRLIDGDELANWVSAAFGKQT